MLLLQMFCTALNKDGKTRCHRHKAEGSEFCWQHKKEHVEEQSVANPANEDLKAELAALKIKVAELEANEKLQKQIKEAEEMAKKELYKTALCKFHAKGTCKNGSKCYFAHGKDELRKVGGNACLELDPLLWHHLTGFVLCAGKYAA